MGLFDNAITMQYTPEETKLVDLSIPQLEELTIKLYAELQEVRYQEKEFSGNSTAIAKEIRIYQKEKKKLIDTYYVRIKRVNKEINDRKEILSRKSVNILVFFKRVAREKLDEKTYTLIWDEAKIRFKDVKEIDKQRQEFI
jgi:uncharacterized protein (DUF885 family)